MSLKSNPPFGLNPEVLTKMMDVFQRCPNIDQVILYGSRAKGTYRPGSDIDICIEGDRLTDADLIQIEEELDDLLLPYKMDISEKKSITNQELLEHISKVGKTIYLRKRSS